MRAEKKEPAIEDLLRAWGLMRVPFAPDEKDTFPARSHQEILPLLDATAALRGVMALTGSPGTGKSTLLKSWLRGLDPKRHLPVLIFGDRHKLTEGGWLEPVDLWWGAGWGWPGCWCCWCCWCCR